MATLAKKINNTKMLSFITPVYNTHPEYIEALANSLLNQDGIHNFEWIVLDNGSTNIETLLFLDRLKSIQFVKL